MALLILIQVFPLILFPRCSSFDTKIVLQMNFDLILLRDEYNRKSGNHYNRKIILSSLCIELNECDFKHVSKWHELFTWIKGLYRQGIELSRVSNELINWCNVYNGRFIKLSGRIKKLNERFSTLDETFSTLYITF
jgi:hypothetical protein